MADLLVANGQVVTMDPDRRVLDDGGVLVDGDEVVAVGPTAELRAEYDASRVIDASGQAVLPGLITTHVHVSDILLRGGINTDRSVYDWLYNVKVPGIAAMTAPEHATAASLYCLEALQSGVTTFVENGIGRGAGFSDPVVEAKLERYDEAGIRSVYAQAFSDKPPSREFETLLERTMAKEPSVNHVSPATVDTDDAIEGIESLVDRYHGTADGRQSVWPAPYLTWGVTPEGFERARELARRHDVMTTTHAAETAFQERGPLSSVEYLSNVGYLGERTLLGHCVHVDDRDIDLLAASGTKVANNVVTNAMLGDGIAPVPTMRRQGVTVAMGTDNASASDTINLLNDLRFAVQVQTAAAGDAAAMTAETALEMATIDAAEAIGRKDSLGSLEPGKKADLVTIDLERPHATPSFDVASTVVYQSRAADVHTVVCNGEVVVDDGDVPGIDGPHPDLRETARDAAAAVVERAGLQVLADRDWTAVGRR